MASEVQVENSALVSKGTSESVLNRSADHAISSGFPEQRNNNKNKRQRPGTQKSSSTQPFGLQKSINAAFTNNASYFRRLSKSDVVQLNISLATKNEENGEWKNKFEELDDNYQDLTLKHQDLTLKHQELNFKHQELNFKHQELNFKHQELTVEHKKTVEENEKLRACLQYAQFPTFVAPVSQDATQTPPTSCVNNLSSLYSSFLSSLYPSDPCQLARPDSVLDNPMILEHSTYAASLLKPPGLPDPPHVQNRYVPPYQLMLPSFKPEPEDQQAVLPPNLFDFLAD